MVDVRKAIDTETNDIVVVKVPRYNCRQTANEARILPKLKHTHILSMHDVVETRFGPAPVYPYAKGGDLLSVIEAASLAEPEVKEIIFRILDAVSYLHQKCVIHGDIRPENVVFIDESHTAESLRIINFGLAIECPPGATIPDQRGSHYYNAPEVLEGNGKGAKSDVWSIGITMFACLTGAFPFDCSVEGEMIAQISSGLPDLLKQKCLSHLSLGCKNLLRQLLQREPNRRIGCAEARSHHWFADLTNWREETFAKSTGIYHSSSVCGRIANA
jgi:serine/threonine protein kinase